jgi:hypothetical protein
MTDTDVKAWGSIELAVKTFLTQNYAALIALSDPGAAVGGDYSYNAGDGMYFRIEKTTSNSDRFGGTFVLDIETWGDDYLGTESRAMDIDALLLGYPHVVEVGAQTWVFDTVSQNTGPQELPWEDDAVSRLGATYVITARRR